MADANNNNPTAHWFRTFGRSSTSSSSTTSKQHPARPDYHRNLPSFHRTPTPTTTHSPTTVESPPRQQHSQQQHSHSHHHHHRKSATATLRTVSSFLSLKGGSGSSSTNIKSGHASSPVEPEFRHEPPIRTPAPLAMLPLTEVDYDDEDGGGARVYRGGRRGGRKATTGEGTAWHNPNLMQQAEMLGAVMARKGAGEALDVCYNSCVLHLIEGFYRLTRRQRETEEQLAELKDLRERELEQFRGMTEEWMETGEAYKAEIKRLELALAQESKDGVASVALARHGSLVDRAGSKRFQARLKRINKTEIQDTAVREERESSSPEPADLVEATSSYRTLGAIPRILDSHNDVMMSRILEQREIEEIRVRRQERRNGRVRAAPVLVRPGGAAEPDNVLESTLRAESSSHTLLYQVASAELKQSNGNGNGNGHVQPNGESRLRPHPAPSTSSSSDLSANTETKAAPSAFRLFGKGNGQPVKGKKNTTGPSQVDGPQDKGKRKLPRLKIKREHRSLQEPLLGPALGNKERRRCYSFEKGDEILTVTSPTFAPEVHTRLGVEAAAQHEASRFATSEEGLADAPVTDEYSEPMATPWPDSDSGLVRHSTSTDTVRWVGKGDGNGDGVNGGAEERETEGSG